MAHEEREPAALVVDVVRAAEAEEGADDPVGGPPVKIGRQRVASKGDEVCRHLRRNAARPARPGQAAGRTAAGALSCATEGRMMRNRVPTPTLLATSIWPPTAVIRL